MDRLAAFGEEIGFTVNERDGVVQAERVPCLLKGGIVGSCTIEKSYDTASGKPTEDIGTAVHAVRITPEQASDGRVYLADGNAFSNEIGGDGQTWSYISIRRGSSSNPEEDTSARELIYRYTKQIIGAVAAAATDCCDPASSTVPTPFNIPNTFEARTGLGPVQDRIRGQRLGIVGLGGTGAYVLDLVSKTPVKEIHLLDKDHADWHNFMRAPGAPTADEIESQRTDPFCKVCYYHSKYAALRKGIHPHVARVDSPAMFAEFLSAHPIDFAFICIDQLSEGDSPRQDVVYEALSAAGIPFVDSGVGITLEDRAVSGAVTTSYYAAGSVDWREAIPNATVHGNLPGYRNVQLPEVNALAASLAVMEWRRRTDQYVSQSTSFLHKFRLETPHIVEA